MSVGVRSISDLRAGLVRALKTIPDLTIEGQWPELLTPPVAVVSGLAIHYDEDTMSDRYAFEVTVYTGDMTDRGAQTRLDSYCDPAGASSVRQAIEQDTMLGGVVQYATVVSVDRYGLHDFQNQRLYGAVFTLQLIAYRS